MTAPNTQGPGLSERDRFEAWARDNGHRGHLARSANGPYVYDDVDDLWEAWQAALAARAPEPSRAEQASDDWVNKLPFGEGMTAMKAAIREALASTPASEPRAEQASDPMQPLVVDSDGVLRFKENRIVWAILEHSRKHGYGLNEIATGDFTADERMQVAQLIGYSLDGYGTLSYVTDESYERAVAASPPRAPGVGEQS
ncbi:hypothetical protein ACSFA8_20860 [Variovorax sp. RT4R15]|uniref:hypothetical protein n=1 Tax=Variovorax sp. RT4R15 TaxID=3443737 RepID=UPI003F47CE9D